jgi:tight adherence protein B
MKRLRLLAVVPAVLAVGLAGAGSAQADGTLTARLSSAGQLPFRTVVVGLPSNAVLTAADVQVFENGDRVKDITVTPASATSDSQFGVVMVIDASDSMRGDAARRAFDAARIFASKVMNTTQLGIVTFNSTPTVLLPLTRDPAQVEEALATPPPLAHGTHLYDATNTAVRLLNDAHIKSGSVIVLSDGADTGSGVREQTVSAVARKHGVAVYAIGLRSRAFDSAALQALAGDAGGSYIEASSPSDLAKIYDRLGSKLANQYLIEYRTEQPSDTRVQVAIKVADLGVAQTVYSTPGGEPGAPFHHSVWATFWRSPIGMILSILASALLIGLAAAFAVRPKGSRLRARVGQFVSVETGKRDRSAGPALTDKLYSSAERSFGRAGFWTRFKRDLELAEIDVKPAQIVMATLLGVLAVGWLIAVVSGFPVLAILGLAVLAVPRAFVQSRVRKRRAAFAEQLPDNLQVMASAMRAGHSFIGALSVVVEDSAEPSASEFRRVVADEQFGVPLEDALRSVVERMENRDLAQVALVAALQRETGGNTAEVLERVTESIRERFELKRLIKTLTAQGRMSRWVVSLLPVGLLLIISAINPDYMQPLFDRPLGRLLLVAGTVLVVSGSLVIKRIVNIKV